MIDLKELLGEELYTPISEKLNGHTVIIAGKDEKYIKDDGNFIPKSRFSEVIEQKNSYKESVDTLKTQLEELKTKAQGNEEIKKQIDELNSKLNQKDIEVTTTSKKYALKDALRDSGARYPDLLLAKFDLSAIEIENEKIKGFEDLLKPVKEAFPDLFGAKSTIKVDGGPNGERPELNSEQKAEAKRLNLSEEDYSDILKEREKIKQFSKTKDW